MPLAPRAAPTHPSSFFRGIPLQQAAPAVAAALNLRYLATLYLTAARHVSQRASTHISHRA